MSRRRVSPEVCVSSLLAGELSLLNFFHKRLPLRVRYVECVAARFCLVALKIVIWAERLMMTAFRVLLSRSNLSNTFTNVNFVVVLGLKVGNLCSFQVELVFTVVKVVLSYSEAAEIFIQGYGLAC